MTFSIGGHAVGIAILFIEAHEDLPVGKAAAFRAGEAIDGAPRRIRMIEPAAARREGGTVGHAIAAIHLEPAPVRIEPVEGACIRFLRHVHRAAPDAPFGIRLAVIHPIAGQVRLRIADQLDRQRIEREAGKTALQSGDEAAPLPLGNPADGLRHRPTGNVAVGKRQAIERGREYIGPIDRVVSRRP